MQGERGPRGERGYNGTKGDRGELGLRGMKGDPGDTTKPKEGKMRLMHFLRNEILPHNNVIIVHSILKLFIQFYPHIITHCSLI